MSPLHLLGERSRTLIAAAFSDRRRAENALTTLKSDPKLYGEASIVQEGDPQIARQLEPEPRGIWRTAMRAHVVLGLAGLAFGLLVAAALVWSGWPAAVESPGFVALFVGVMGLFIGGMLGGLVTLRPDHAVIIRAVRDQLKKGYCAVIVRPISERSAKEAYAILEGAGGLPVRSL